MSRCIVCNRRISKKDYFCDSCLTEETGRLPRRNSLGILSWLALLPFSASEIPTHWLSTEEKLDWVVQKTDQITARFPQIPTEYVIDVLCARVELDVAEHRDQALLELELVRANKETRLWAPLGVVVQPSFQAAVLLIGMLGLLVLALNL